MPADATASTDEDDPDGEPPSRDVAVIGGGPAGCAAALFTARYGLDTAVYDRGPSSLRRCAFLANYLGFPGGVDVDTFLELAHAQVREAGATIEAERVEAIEATCAETIERPGAPNAEEDTGSVDVLDSPVPSFRLELQGGAVHHADRVIAATRSGGEYLRPLCGDDAFEAHEYDGEVHEHFDPDYADVDGRTPIEGCYVASPAGERDVQAIVAAGQGAHVARRLLADRRADRGFPDGLDEVYDWLRPDAEFSGGWGERDGWREWFASRLPEDANPADDEHLRALREEYVDHALATRRSPEDIERLTERSVERLVETLGPDRLLDAIGEERINSYLSPDDQASAEVSPDG